MLTGLGRVTDGVLPLRSNALGLETSIQMAQAQTILRCAFTHIPTHGFTRRAIALSMPGSATQLSETAISALFGAGDNADRTLIRAWLEEGRAQMNPVAPHNGESSSTAGSTSSATMEEVLLRRLKWNEPVLHHLKDVRYLFRYSLISYITCRWPLSAI